MIVIPTHSSSRRVLVRLTSQPGPIALALGRRWHSDTQRHITQLRGHMRVAEMRLVWALAEMGCDGLYRAPCTTHHCLSHSPEV